MSSGAFGQPHDVAGHARGGLAVGVDVELALGHEDDFVIERGPGDLHGLEDLVAGTHGGADGAANGAADLGRGAVNGAGLVVESVAFVDADF